MIVVVAAVASSATSTMQKPIKITCGFFRSFGALVPMEAWMWRTFKAKLCFTVWRKFKKLTLFLWNASKVFKKSYKRSQSYFSEESSFWGQNYVKKLSRWKHTSKKYIEAKSYQQVVMFFKNMTLALCSESLYRGH